MDKIKLSDLIAAKFPECLKKDANFIPLYFPHIPDVRQAKAEKNFVKYKYKNETMIMLFDTSLFERGKNGLVFTDKAIYFKDIIGATRVCRYCDWRRDRDDLAKILGLTDDNAFILTPFLNELMNEISTMIKYEGGAEDESADEAEDKESKNKSESNKSSAKKSTTTKKKSATTKKKKGVSQSTIETVMGVAEVVMDVLEDPL